MYVTAAVWMRRIISRPFVGIPTKTQTNILRVTEIKVSRKFTADINRMEL